MITVKNLINLLKNRALIDEKNFSAITGSYKNGKSHDKTFFLQELICGYSLYYSSRVNKLAIKLNNSTINGKKCPCFGEGCDKKRYKKRLRLSSIFCI